MTVDLPTLSELEAARPPVAAEIRTIGVIDSPRILAIKEAATSLGARTGLVTRATAIMSDMNAMKVDLDRIFAFQFLVLPQNVIPPVLVEGRAAVSLPDNRILNIVDRVYRIEEQARFTTTPISWRDYLYRGLSVNGRAVSWPDAALLPQTNPEKQVWQENIRIGWENGVAQADSIFQINLARLERDFNGMLLYHELKRKNMVSEPMVANANFGVTGNADHQLNINERVYRITVTPAFKLDPKQWMPR